MAREKKYGLAIIALLCNGLVAAIVWKLSSYHEASPQVADVATAKAPAGLPLGGPSADSPRLIKPDTDGDRLSGNGIPPTLASPAIATVSDSSEARAARVALRPAEPLALTPLPEGGIKNDPMNPPVEQIRVLTDLEAGQVDPTTARQAASADEYADPRAAVPPSAPPPAPATYGQGYGTEYRRTDVPVADRTAALAPQPAPDAGVDRIGGGTYTVQPNDTFWTISERLYGSGAYFKALSKFNQQKYPQGDHLAVGDSILAPPMATLRQQFPTLCPKQRRQAGAGVRAAGLESQSTAGTRQYEVRDGDTLFNIARFELGDGARWVEIYQLNRQLLTDDFHYVKPGSILTLPGRKHNRDVVAGKPTDSVQR